ncbi:MAG: hypothetical protein QM785_05410 [Pyrinomonadaceae bacterium]
MSKIISPVAILLFLAISVMTQVSNGTQIWQKYSPSRHFTLEVPGQPSPAQGHIFDPASEKTISRYFRDGEYSKVHNFEIEERDQRQFLASILELRTSKSRPRIFLTAKELEMVNAAVGDNIVTVDLVRKKSTSGEIISWNYRKKGNDEDVGMVVAKSLGRQIVIVVISFDFIESKDLRLRKMADSLDLSVK